MSTPTACTASLAGWIEGETWTRWRVAGEGQVRFWLRPVRESLGLLLCAVPVRTASDLRTASELLAPKRYVELVADPVAADKTDTARDEVLSRVIFLAVEASVGGFPLVIPAAPAPAPAAEISACTEHLGTPHAQRASGKMAAAGEHEEGEG